MALGIEHNGIYKTYAIPLLGLMDEHWRDNTWICEHLRQLAYSIERDNLEIFKVSLDFDHNYKIPHLKLHIIKP